MRFLLDGYNLMHFLGLVRPRSKKSLERSRADLQEWLRRVHGPRVGDVTLVFDGRQFDGAQPAALVDHGLRVQFSQGEPADDLIAEMIGDERRPKQMTVVSNDRRVQEAAKRRRCLAWSCGEYVDWVLDSGLEPPKPPREAEKTPDTPEEQERWRREFADIDQDPELRRFNRMYEDFQRE